MSALTPEQEDRVREIVRDVLIQLEVLRGRRAVSNLDDDLDWAVVNLNKGARRDA